MHILLLAQHYAPEEVSGAVLATELAEDLVRRGHQVTFVTCAPNYPAGQIFAGYRNTLHSSEMRNGVRIMRVWSFITSSKGFWPRIFNYGTFSLMALFGGLFAEKPDLIFSYSPPLPLGLAAWLLQMRWRSPWVLRVEDLYPDAAIAAGALRNGTAIRFFQGLERFLYSRATQISLISEGFRRNLLAKGVAPGKLSVTPVWADPDGVQPQAKENAFRQAHGLTGAFVVLYAGALGHTSALEEAIDAATLLQDLPMIHFVFVGEGVKKAALMQAAARHGVQNVSFLPFQPRERFAEMLAAADVSLVTLNAQSSSYSLPSKTFNIMASARPILAVTPPDSEIAQLVTAHRCGVVASLGDPARLAATVRALYADRGELDQQGQRGRALLLTRYSRRVCIESFANLMAQINHAYDPTHGVRA
jgi:colanic acid biosynthesis glycosyl transferase WcaI